MGVDVSSIYMPLEEVMAVMGYTSTRNAYRLIRSGKFPIPMVKFQGRWVADVEVVKRYFQIRRERGFAELERKANEAYAPRVSRASQSQS